MSSCCNNYYGSVFSALLAVGLIAGIGMVYQAQGVNAVEKDKQASTAVLRHVVLFKYKDGTSEDDVKKIVDAFRALPSKIDAISDFEYGVNNSPEGLNDGLTHAFLVTFKKEEDRAKYLPHPEHAKFVEILKPHLDKALVVDYWSHK